MTRAERQDLIDELSETVRNVQFRRIVAICVKVFGEPRIKGSHCIFKTGLKGHRAMVNLQPDKKSAKPYQVRQVIAAIRETIEGVEEP